MLSVHTNTLNIIRPNWKSRLQKFNGHSNTEPSITQVCKYKYNNRLHKIIEQKKMEEQYLNNNILTASFSLRLTCQNYGVFGYSRY